MNDKIIRTPDERFKNLPGFPFAPHYAEVNGLRLHFVDEGQGNPILCLHGEPSWSFLYRKMIPLLAASNRVIAPDFIGFGRSDKLISMNDYSFSLHRKTLIQLLEWLDLTRITLVCQDWGGLIGLTVASQNPERFSRLVIMNTGLPGGEPMGEAFMRWRKFVESLGTELPIGRIMRGGMAHGAQLPDNIIAAYDAPFPDERYKAGAAAWPLLVPTSPDDPGAFELRNARKALAQWQKPALIMFSDKDPITRGGDQFFRRLIPSADDQPEITIHDAGHFLQEEKGEEIAAHILSFIERTPII